MKIILRGPFDQITWIFCPGQARVLGNERTDVLAGAAVIDNNLTLDPPTVLQCIKDHLSLSRPQTSSYTLTFLKEKESRPRKMPMTPEDLDNFNLKLIYYEILAFS